MPCLGGRRRAGGCCWTFTVVIIASTRRWGRATTSAKLLSHLDISNSDQEAANDFSLTRKARARGIRSLGTAADGSQNHMEFCTLVQRARTFVPTVVIAAIAAMTMRPATSAYSSTSPPRSSVSRFTSRGGKFVGPPCFQASNQHEATFSDWTDLGLSRCYAPDTNFTISGRVEMFGRIIAKSVNNTSSGGRLNDELLPAVGGSGPCGPVQGSYIEVP
jgi:hypothetical protein